MVDLAQTISEWKDVEGNKEDDQYLGDICFSLRYVPTSGKVNLSIPSMHISSGSELGYYCFNFSKSARYFFTELCSMQNFYRSLNSFSIFLYFFTKIEVDL